MDRKGTTTSKRSCEDLQTKRLKYRKHTTDTMPDVLGAIEAVKRKDQFAIKACNRIGDYRISQYGLIEESVTPYSE